MFLCEQTRPLGHWLTRDRLPQHALRHTPLPTPTRLHTHTSPSARTSLSSLTPLLSQCLSHRHALSPLLRGTSPSLSSPSTNRSPDTWAAYQLAYQTPTRPPALPLSTADWEAAQDSVQRIGGPPNKHQLFDSGGESGFKSLRLEQRRLG